MRLQKRVQCTVRHPHRHQGRASLLPEPVRDPEKRYDVAMGEPTPDPELTAYHLRETINPLVL